MAAHPRDTLAPVKQYLERHAEPEACVAPDLKGRFGRVLVVPVYREPYSLLDGYRRAARACASRTLCIAVLNGRADSDARAHAANTEFLKALSRQCSSLERVSEAPPIYQADAGDFELLVVDRASPGQRFEARDGVGLARRIGADIALGLYASGQLDSPWIFNTDADVQLADDYFVEAGSGAANAAALLYPFWHVPSGDVALDRATALYELSLRYYVLGLGYARSPYAFHSMGSAIALHAEAYAMVRGFPRRQAAEDFYVLGKLAKVGPLQRLAKRPVLITSRRSDRVVFGTGPAVARIENAGFDPAAFRLYDPASFEVIRQLIRCIDEFSRTRDYGRASRHLHETRLGRRAQAHVLHGLGLEAALASASEQASDEARLRRRLHTWFDGFRTLKLVRALRSHGFEDVPWERAVASASFCAGPVADEAAAGDELARLRNRLNALEARSPSRLGPTLAASERP